MLDAMQAELDAIEADPMTRRRVIAGAGSAFSGGHDLKEMMAHRNRGVHRRSLQALQPGDADDAARCRSR
jgi:enoyl-CoA hydratase/carnithine racemase